MAEAYTYILECADGSLYTGWTNDLAGRPVHLVYFESFATKGEALSREAAIKKMTRAAKLALIDTAEKRNYNK